MAFVICAIVLENKKLDDLLACQRDSQKNALFLKERIINIPSGVR